MVTFENKIATSLASGLAWMKNIGHFDIFFKEPVELYTLTSNRFLEILFGGMHFS